MTLLGAFFIPITILCFLWRPQHLLSLLILTSVFEAGSVLNGAIGHFVFGVSPFHFVEICVAIRLLLWVWHRELGCRRAKHPQGGSQFYCSLPRVVVRSGLVMPAYLQEYRSMLRERWRTWTWYWLISAPSVDLEQPRAGLYLTLNVAAVLYAFHVIRTTVQAEKLAKALRWAVFTVVAAGLCNMSQY